jgi:2'-5' RNA ligase
MRLFFALALDEPLRAAAASVAADLQRRLAATRSDRAIKWVERQNLHVTMRFLGEVDDARAQAIIQRLREPLPDVSFDLAVGGAGAFPPAGPPRVLWIGAGAGADAARAVFDRIEERLSSLGFEPEHRAYTPHMTLGRVREINRTLGTKLREWLAEVPAQVGIQRVTRVTLYRSHLSSAGPRYEGVGEVPLS